MASLTIATAARLCGCPRSTLQRAIRAGRLHLDADHRLDTDDLIRAGYLTATAAQPPHAPAAQQKRQGLEDLLRTMQRSMERLTDAINVLSQEVRKMQQERSSSATPPAIPTQQPRRMKPQQPAPTHTGRPGVAPATLQAIAAARVRSPDLTMKAFAQLLFDEGIYRGRARDGREVPADHSRLRRWLVQAQQAERGRDRAP